MTSSPSGIASISSSLKVSPFFGEELLRGVAIDHLAGERAVARDDLAHLGLDLRQIVRRERLVAREVVIEAVLDDRADGHLRAGIELLHRLGHHMRRVVADQRRAPRVLAREEFGSRRRP